MQSLLSLATAQLMLWMATLLN